MTPLRHSVALECVSSKWQSTHIINLKTDLNSRSVNITMHDNEGPAVQCSLENNAQSWTGTAYKKSWAKLSKMYFFWLDPKRLWIPSNTWSVATTFSIAIFSITTQLNSKISYCCPLCRVPLYHSPSLAQEIKIFGKSDQSLFYHIMLTNFDRQENYDVRTCQFSVHQASQRCSLGGARVKKIGGCQLL